MDPTINLLAKLYASIKRKKKNPKNPEKSAPGIHLPFLVCLLESAGYQIRKVESVDPKSMFKKTASIVVSCGESGQRYFLEMPKEKNHCDCLLKGPDTGDFFLEAFSNGKTQARWLDNSASHYCVPFISDELKSSSGAVLEEMVTVMRDNFKEMKNVGDQVAVVTNEDCDLIIPEEVISKCVITETDSNVEVSEPERENIIEQIISEEPVEIVEGVIQHAETEKETTEDVILHHEIEQESEDVITEHPETIENTENIKKHCNTDEKSVKVVKKELHILGQTFVVDKAAGLNGGLKPMTNSPLRRSYSDSGRSMIPKRPLTSSTSTSNSKISKSTANLRVEQSSGSSTNSSLRRSHSDSSRRGLNLKETIASTLRKSSLNSKICKSSDNLGVDQPSTSSANSSLKRSRSDSGRPVPNLKQTVTSTLRKSGSNIKVANEIPSKNIMPKLLQSARKMITNKTTPKVKVEKIKASPNKTTSEKAIIAKPVSSPTPNKTPTVKKISSKKTVVDMVDKPKNT